MPQQPPGARPNLLPYIEEMRERQRSALRRFFGWLIQTSFYLLVLAGVGFGGYWLWSRKPEKAAATQTPAQPDTPQAIDKLQQQLELTTAASIQAERLRVAKTKQELALLAGANALRAFDDWLSELDRWTSQVEALLGDESGKAVAASKALVKQFRAICAVNQFEREHVIRLKAVAETLLAPVRAAHQNPTDALLPGKDLAEQLEDLHAKARAGKAQCRKAQLQVRALVARARASTKPGTRLLREAVLEQEQEEAHAEVPLVEAAFDVRRKRQVELVAEARAQAIRIEANAEREWVRKEAEAQQLREKERMARQEAESKAKAELERKRILARSVDVQQTLLPFIRTTHHGPVSLSQLRSMGALQKDRGGLEALAWAGTRDNSRPGWQLSSRGSSWTHQQEQFLWKAQRYLIDYGEALVAEGLLAP